MGEYDSSQWKTNYSYVFINGLMGWGQYDAQYKAMPYWGVFGGEMMKKLNVKQNTITSANSDYKLSVILSWANPIPFVLGGETHNQELYNIDDGTNLRM